MQNKTIPLAHARTSDYAENVVRYAHYPHPCALCGNPAISGENFVHVKNDTITTELQGDGASELQPVCRQCARTINPDFLWTN